MTAPRASEAEDREANHEVESDQTVFERRDPLIGATLDDRFRIDARLAAGGFGAIYRAADLRAGREIALKVLHSNLTADPLIVARFRREGATLASLRDPHTVTAYELGEASDGTLYIVMELLRGETLFDAYRKQGGPLPWRRVTAIARAVCSSLAEAHERGIVHRDLKPANIHLQERDGKRDFVKVLDFGIAKILRGSDLDQSELTHAGQMIGTFDYMAPEQMLGGTVGAACDIYTLGVVAYEMITGRLPFADATSPTHLLAMLLTTPPPPMSAHAQVPASLDHIVMKCLEREPQDRFASVVEIAAALDAVLAEVEGPTSPMRLAAADEPTLISQRVHAPSSPSVPILPKPPTRLTPTRSPAVVRAQGSSPSIEPVTATIVRNDGRASQPPMRNDGRASQPPMRNVRASREVAKREASAADYNGSRASQFSLPSLAAYPPVRTPERLDVTAPGHHAPAKPVPARPTPARTPQPQLIDPRAVAYPRVGAIAAYDPRASAPAIAAYDPRAPQPIVDAHGSRPYVDARGSQPALPIQAAWQPLPPARSAGSAAGGFDAARDAAVRRIVWALALVLAGVLTLIVAKLV